MSGSINEAEGPRPQREPSAFFALIHGYGVVFAGLALLLACLATIDGVGESADSAAWDAPGLTLDEIFNIQAGDYLVESLLIRGPAVLTAAGVQQVFGDPRYNPDHPPLARLWIGLWHAILRGSAAEGELPPRFSVKAARYSVAVLFVLTIALVGRFTARWYGRWAGWMAAVSLVLMPRVFGHAHLAALETSIGLMFTATVLYIADRWGVTGSSRSLQTARSDRLQPVPPPAIAPWRSVILAGILLGLALLTKIQAIILPIPIGLWALWLWRGRAIPRLLVFGLVGVAVFFLGWPWLWLDPVDHTLQYLGRTTNRPTLNCYFLGQRYADAQVPWHYSFVMFLVTVPVGLHAIGFWGLWRATRNSWRKRPASDAEANRIGHDSCDAGIVGNDPRGLLIAGTILFVLTFFALPGITVYDGERLFLVVFLLWAVLIGRGMSRVVPVWSTPRPWQRVLAILLFAGGMAEGVYSTYGLHPCQLSYYNLAVGGLSGADRLGFEPTYWRDSFTRRLLEEVAAAVPPQSTLYIAPVLHPANRIDLQLLSPILQEHGLQTDSYDDKNPDKTGMRYVLVFRRHADPWDSLEPNPQGARLLCEVRRAGVQLAACYDLRPEE